MNDSAGSSRWGWGESDDRTSPGVENRGPGKKRICRASCSGPLNKPCIDHINRIRDDNIIENLRWATHSENSQNRSDNNEELYITKNIDKKYKQGYLWAFQLYIDGKTKSIKKSIDKEFLIKFRDEWLKDNNI